MTTQNPDPTFENVSQRVVFSYRRQMLAFVPVLPPSLSPSERDEMQNAQKELDAFFRALYQCAYDRPEAFGLPVADDVYVDRGASTEKKQAVTKAVKKARDKLILAVDYLYHAGRLGVLVDGRLRLGHDEYASFFAKSPRVKRKLVTGLQDVGLTVSEQEDAFLIGNTAYPAMMPALRALAEACWQREDQRLAALLFARCDFRALDAVYRPGVLDMLQTTLPPAEHNRAVELHHALGQLDYTASLQVSGAHNWRIQYQGKRAVKSTAFLEYEYDERARHPLQIKVKCAATNRLVPLLPQQPALLQQDFFRHAHSCAAPKCSWCKTRKSLQPSKLEYGGERRTICWWMQRHFDRLDAQAVDLVQHYAQLHEALLAA
jgi:hypothetical protein